MASERGKIAVLAAILLVFVAVVWRQLTSEDAGGSAAPAASSARAAAGLPQGPVRPPAGSSAGVPAIALPALGSEGQEPVDTGRDPFRFGTAAAPGAGAGGRGARPAPAAPPGVGAGGPVGPAAPAGPPPPPPIELRYIGTAKQGAAGRQYAVLRDDRGIYYGAEGDVIEGRYRILRVSADSVDVAYVDGRGRRTIALTGGRS